jgi:ribosomal protein S18 acetylase RimI-like enzyme
LLSPDGTAWTIRRAEAGDGELIVDMALEAFNWRPVVGLSRPELLSDPQLAVYGAGWPREGDLGVVADLEGKPIGAAWVRRYERRERTFGFVGRDTPELTIAVVKPWRGQGVGRSMLNELVALARSAGIEKISLSVEHQNPAAGLYTSAGFKVLNSKNGADTMVKDLRALS